VDSQVFMAVLYLHRQLVETEIYKMEYVALLLYCATEPEVLNTNLISEHNLVNEDAS